MLNRRLLRIKAMQAVYAFKQAMQANQEIITEQVNDYFFDQVSIEGSATKAKYDEEKAVLLEHFAEAIARQDIWTDFEPAEGVSPKALEFIVAYRNKSLKEFFLIKERFLQSLHGLTGTYLGLVQVLKKLADCTQRERAMKEGKAHTSRPYNEKLEKFYHHPFLVCMREDDEAKASITAYGEKFDQDQIEDWYRTLKSMDVFQELLDHEGPEGEDGENDIARGVVREFFFKDDSFLSVFEENNLSWTEDKAILRSLVMKTIKEAKENKYDKLRLLTLSKDWEEDRTFFSDLYEQSLKEERQNLETISDKSEKWAANRIAILDLIMISMAITEIRYFRNIPVKVTMNEYIDISKNYSTPKSWQFINGMLDNIVKDMNTAGLIKKSGRGLLDNK